MGKDYPRTLIEFEARFSTQRACHEYLAQLRWPDGFVNCYLDEFTFRFNRRTSSSRGLLFYRLLQQAVVTTPTLQTAIIAPSRSRPAASGASS